MSKTINYNSNKTHLLTCNEAAEYLGVKPQTLAMWRLTKRYNLPFIKVGRHCKYLLADLNEFLARNKKQCFGGENEDL